MVHLDKVEGQRGSMVLHEDGSIVSSTGELSSSEQTAQTVLSLLSHSLQVDFNANRGAAAAAVATTIGQSSVNGYVNPAAVNDSGAPANAAADNTAFVPKWNRVTVSFGDHSYVACLSNRKIHVVKRDCVGGDERVDPPPPEL